MPSSAAAWIALPARIRAAGRAPRAGATGRLTSLLGTFGYYHDTGSCLLSSEICKMNSARGYDFLPIREGRPPCA